MNLNGRRYGHIRVERILGQGGMGDVYEGFDEKLTRRVALKVLHHEALIDDEAKARLTREARTLSQLDHPNICRIYDFIEDGESDVLVLELIDGRTLQQAMNDGLSHAEKVRIAHDVASVLVAAHRAGILHRDLKPENVMLTKSGVVKVLDFGLARWLERRSGRSYRAVTPAEAMPRLAVAEPDTEQWPAMQAGATAVLQSAPVHDYVSVHATAVGVTVGTPLFMSPEQARGEPLTTASDIYSFGLMLQALFTGTEPYPVGLNAREVMLMAARGNSLPVTGVPHDIGALIKALKAFAPSDRPTAADALQGIKKIVDAPKRIVRRVALAALLALVVLGGWKYTIDLRRERTAAREAEAEAKRRRADADSLIGFMLGDLKRKLEPVGRLDIMNDVAERSLAYMSSLHTELMSPQEIARNSKALNQLGEVRMSQGNLAAAIEVFNKSLALATTASERNRNDPDLALGVGTAHFWVGNAQRLKGDLPAALRHMREYQRISEELAKKYPTNDEYQVERAYGHSNVGTILDMQGDLVSALDEYRVTLEVGNARLAGAPRDPKRQDDVAIALNKTGFALERLGRLSEARSYYEREFAIYSDLARSDSRNARWKDRTANSHEYLASVLQSLGEIDAAAAHADGGVAMYLQLVAYDPTNTDWRRNVASSLSRQAVLLTAQHRSREAVEKLGVAESMISQLLNHESRTIWQRDFGGIDTAYARALLETGALAQAQAKASAAISALQTVPGAAGRFTAEAYIASAEAAAAAHENQLAVAAWKEARTCVQAAASSTSDPRVLSIYARALIATGDVEEGRGVLARLRSTGYRGPELDQFCAKRGC